MRFRTAEVTATAARPQGIKYAFTLHDVDGARLPDFDNAHGVPRALAFDHRHRFRRPDELVSYAIQGADELICDFFPPRSSRHVDRKACRLNSTRPTSSWSWRTTM